MLRVGLDFSAQFNCYLLYLFCIQFSYGLRVGTRPKFLSSLSLVFGQLLCVGLDFSAQLTAPLSFPLVLGCCSLGFNLGHFI